MKWAMASVLGATLLLTAAHAGAMSDVIVRERRDEDRNKIFELINTGQRNVWAKVRLVKRCTGQTNDSRKPKVTEHFVSSQSKVRLGRAWADTTCSYDYRIVEADYR